MPTINHPHIFSPEVLSRTFRDRRRKTILLSIVPAIVIGAGIVILKLSINTSSYGFSREHTFGAVIIGTVLLLLINFIFWRCPACNKWLKGQQHPKRCPHCGCSFYASGQNLIEKSDDARHERFTRLIAIVQQVKTSVVVICLGTLLGFIFGLAITEVLRQLKIELGIAAPAILSAAGFLITSFFCLRK